jgi:phosphopantetheinyl transferase
MKAANAITIACAQLPQPLSASLRARWRMQLPYGRRLHASPEPLTQSQSLLGVALACGLLARLTHRSLRPAQLRYSKQGKPYAQGFPDFSISHSGDWVVCAMAGAGSIGVDVQALADGATAGAVAVWSAKEATLKAAGASLQDLPRMQVCGERVQFLGRRWYCAAPRLTPAVALRVVSSLPIDSLQLRRWSAQGTFAGPALPQ